MTSIIEENLLTEKSKSLTTGDTFSTRTSSALRFYTINDIGQAQEQNAIVLSPVVDTSARQYDDFISSSTEKMMARIIDINDDNEVLAEIYLPEGEIHKKLNSYYVSILRNKSLCYVGAEFYISYEKIEDGLNIRIEKIEISNEAIDPIYEDVFKELGM